MLKIVEHVFNVKMIINIALSIARKCSVTHANTRQRAINTWLHTNEKSNKNRNLELSINCAGVLLHTPAVPGILGAAHPTWTYLLVLLCSTWIHLHPGENHPSLPTQSQRNHILHQNSHPTAIKGKLQLHRMRDAIIIVLTK